DLVSVGRDDELEPSFLRSASVDVPQVEPVRLAVDLEQRAGLEGTLDHALDVDVAWGPLPDPPAGEVADYVDVGVLHRLEHALGRTRVGSLVHRGADPVE